MTSHILILRCLRALIFLELLFTTTMTSKHLNIRPTVSTATACPQTVSCHTLQELVQNLSDYFQSYTTFTFQSGYHNVNCNCNVLIQNARNITLLGDLHASSVIQCTSVFGLTFMNATNLIISNLQFQSCGALIPEQSKPTMHITKLLQLVNYITTLYFIHVSNAKISSIEVHNSTGVGMLGINTLASISHTTFTNNVPNCIFVFSDNPISSTVVTTEQIITDSSFILGSPQKNTDYASGLTMVFTQTTYTITVTISNVTAYRNKGKTGTGNILFKLDTCSYQCTSIEAYSVNSTLAVGDGMGWDFRNINGGAHCNQNCSKTFKNIHIFQSYLSNNSGSGIFINNQHPQRTFTIAFEIKRTTINGNGDNGLSCGNIDEVYLFDTTLNHNQKAAIDAYKTRLIFGGNTTVASNTGYWGIMKLMGSEASIFGISSFIGNKGKVSGAIIATGSVVKFKKSTHVFSDNEGDDGGAIHLKNNSQVEFWDGTLVQFERNQAQRNGGAIFVEDSTIIFKSLASVTFTNNTGYNGGALALIDNSHISLQTSFQVQFLQNHAKRYGGAIYLNDYNVEIFNKGELPSCFFTVESYRFAQTSSIALEQVNTFALQNNTAKAGGDLYGGWIDLCVVKTNARYIYMYSLHGTEAFDHIFRKHNGGEHLSIISSNPTRVCICLNSTPNCNITQYNVTAYPGETFQVPAVAVGQRSGTVPFTVQSSFISTSKIVPLMGTFHYTQMVRGECTKLTYNIRSSNKMEIIHLQVDKFDVPDSRLINDAVTSHFLSSSVASQFIDLQMHIMLLPCPLGFVFDEHLMTCSCASKLHQYNIVCNISTRKVSRPTSFWITVTHVDNNSNITILHEHCPFDYCKPDSFDLNLENPDEQCAFHRSGILCGACQNNLSHVFGTSACRECSSLWALLWVPVIALAGIALVVLLILLNLTVSVGTINGLIFYANIVRANHATFFPPNTTNSFLSWFIAWINLDLGIETCFYNGLDAYVKTWLQFVFPLYIWFLVIAIIVLSHYYTLAARLSGRNAVQVLATLFLLSYAKLLRIIITVFQSTELEYPNSVRKVWLYDGNINYLNGKHIPLFIAALLLLLISLPYTVILIFIQHLQHWSSYRVLFWVKKLKPLFDAYTGPYKDKHRYWTGLLLLVRIVLFLIFSTTVGGNLAINLFAISTTVLCILVYTSLIENIYKVWYLNALEFFSFFNLGLLSSTTLYMRQLGGNQTTCIYTSTVIALAMFVIVAFLHLITSIKSSSVWKTVSKTKNQRCNPLPLVVQENNEETPQQLRAIEIQKQVLHFNELREPLLENCNSYN